MGLIPLTWVKVNLNILNTVIRFNFFRIKRITVLIVLVKTLLNSNNTTYIKTLIHRYETLIITSKSLRLEYNTSTTDRWSYRFKNSNSFPSLWTIRNWFWDLRRCCTTLLNHGMHPLKCSSLASMLVSVWVRGCMRVCALFFRLFARTSTRMTYIVPLYRENVSRCFPTANKYCASYSYLVCV